MLDRDSERIVMRLAEKAFENGDFCVALLDSARRERILVEKRKHPPEPLYGIQPALMAGLLSLGEFNNIEEFIEAAKKLEVDYGK